MPYATLAKYIEKQNKAIADNPELNLVLGHVPFPTDPEQLTAEQASVLVGYMQTEASLAPSFLCEHHLAEHQELIQGAYDELVAMARVKAAAEGAAG